jgi:hypothetical protein
VCFYVKIAVSDGGNQDASDGVKSIGLSFVQILSLLTTFPIAWPAMFTAVFHIGGAVTVLGQHFVNLKCMFPERSEAEVFYSSRIAWALIPLALLSACALTWCLWNDLVPCLTSCCRKKKDAEEERESQPSQQQQQQQHLTLRQKIHASNAALLYLIWPGLCSETFALFACQNFCGNTSSSRLRVDLSEVCFQGRHAAFAYCLGLPMLFLYVIGLPVGALVMVWRLHRRAVRKNKCVYECKGHSTWGLFYSAFREEKWWWEGTVAMRKIVVAMIGVFGTTMEEMQVSVTLMLVFLVILFTAVTRPYGENRNGTLLQRLEMSTLCLLFFTLWAASVFSLYPRCELREGESLWWCESVSVFIGLADLALVVMLIVLFFLLKKAAAICCLDRCCCCCGPRFKAWFRAHWIEDPDVKDNVIVANPLDSGVSQIEMVDLPLFRNSAGEEERHPSQQPSEPRDPLPLPEGWSYAYNDDGDVYYISPEYESQWERP